VARVTTYSGLKGGSTGYREQRDYGTEAVIRSGLESHLKENGYQVMESPDRIAFVKTGEGSKYSPPLSDQVATNILADARTNGNIDNVHGASVISYTKTGDAAGNNRSFNTMTGMPYERFNTEDALHGGIATAHIGDPIENESTRAALLLSDRGYRFSENMAEPPAGSSIMPPADEQEALNMLNLHPGTLKGDPVYRVDTFEGEEHFQQGVNNAIEITGREFGISPETRSQRLAKGNTGRGASGGGSAGGAEGGGGGGECCVFNQYGGGGCGPCGKGGSMDEIVIDTAALAIIGDEIKTESAVSYAASMQGAKYDLFGGGGRKDKDEEKPKQEGKKPSFFSRFRKGNDKGGKSGGGGSSGGGGGEGGGGGDGECCVFNEYGGGGCGPCHKGGSNSRILFADLYGLT
jgi:hypothetical protein